MASKDPLALPTLISHVKDSKDFHVAKMFGEHVYISQPYSGKPLHEGGVDLGSGNFIEPFDLQITRFIIIEVLVAIIMIGLFLLLAGKIKNGRIPKGRIWNFFEVMLLFVRDQVARPAIGKHDADQFVPFLWTLFFFVLDAT